MPDAMEPKRLNLGFPALSFQPVLPILIDKALLADKYMILSVTVFLSVLQKPFDQIIFDAQPL